MRKLFTRVFTLLMVLMLLSCAVSCTNTDESSTEISVEVAETSMEESKEIPECIHRTEIDSFLTGEVDRTLERANILRGRAYTVSRESGESYPDTDLKKLTDESYAVKFNTFSWVGYSGSTPVTVDFDLGETVKNIGGAEVRCLRQLDYGIGLPGDVSVYASQDGENYILVGKLNRPNDLLATQFYSFVFEFQGSFDARYLRFFMNSQESGWFFVDDICAYVYGAEGIKSGLDIIDYYGESSFDPSAPETVTDNSDETVNLALGREVRIGQFNSFDIQFAVESDNTPIEKASLLTDGKNAAATWASPDMFKITRGRGRIITVDLGSVCAVSGVSIQVLNQTSWGVFEPSAIVASVSENGVDWDGVMDCKSDYPEGDVTELNTYEATLDKPYKARYVRFYIKLMTSHTGLSELSVSGTRAVPSDALTVMGKSNNDCYLTADDFGGYENILCTPICSGSPGSPNYDYGMTTSDDFLPYVAYMKDGKITDTFMDCFLFSPTSTYVTEQYRHTLTGWNHYMDVQFQEGYNIDALNSAVGTVADALGNQDLKAGILLSVLRTKPYNGDGSVNTFGDFDGDGTNDAFNEPENRKRAAKWLIDTQLERFESGNYGNLKVAGFYWHEEALYPDDTDEKEVMDYIVGYIHSLGYKVLWIPYFEARGFREWHDTGVDVTCYQPNYSFMKTYDRYRLTECAIQSRMYGACVEIEAGDLSNPDDAEKYREYLRSGVTLGYMNAIKVYYQGVIPGELSYALNENELSRDMYDATYLYAKKRLTADYGLTGREGFLAPDDKTVTAKGKVARGVVSNKTEFDVTYEIAVSPKYGTLRLDRLGSFVYSAPDNFVGTDTFELRAVYSSGRSENATVTVIFEQE